MASNYLDDYISNFDLNELKTADVVQPQNANYEKLRKNVSWLKSRIIGTDFVIQKFQANKEQLEQSLKTHIVIREELKQVCINYKDASEKCIILENENKTLLVNQEVLKKRLIDVETKYDALISHANQLQMLVKQLENDKDALTIEKELNKCSNRDGNQAIELQHEKDEMLKDFTALKDVVLGKKKTSKRHVNIIKKYVKDVKYKGPKILCTSEESSNDFDNNSNISHLARKIPEKVHDGSDDEFISSEEHNIFDNYSDGQLSVDTGRGSSRANSHDKYLNSPDYVVDHEAVIKPSKDVIKQVDVATSPIQFSLLRSIATSPIRFDEPALFEDQYGDNTDCPYGVDYIHEVPLSKEIYDLIQQEQLAACDYPVRRKTELIDIDKSPIKNDERNIIKEAENMPSSKTLSYPSDEDETIDLYQDTIIDTEISRCMCNKSDTPMINYEKKFIDACTSPLPASHDVLQYVDIGINTEQDESVNHHKSTATIGINTINEMEGENPLSTNCERNSSFSHIKFTGIQLVDASTSTNLIPLDNADVVDTEMGVPSKKQNEKCRKSLHTGQEELPATDEQTSRNLNNKRCSKLSENKKYPTEEVRAQEKVCLESNSSKKLHFANSNDVEVQNILNVMKLHNDLISPISKTPCDSDYLKLIPDINYTVGMIWNAIKTMAKKPNSLRHNDTNSQNSTEINNLQEIIEIEINNRNDIVRAPNQVTNSTIDTNSSISADNTRFEQPLPNIKKSNLDKSKTRKSNLFESTLMPESRTDNTIIAEENKSKPQQLQLSNSCNKIGEDNINYINRTNYNNLIAEDYNKEKDLQQQNDSELNEFSEVNNTETSIISETRTGHTIIIHGTKTKKKSKLDKLREKMIPTCKIKKMTPSIIKDAPKTYVKPKHTATSASLNQKLAYENAVKVMAELRANQELQDKKKLIKPIKEDSNSESKSNKINSSLSETVESNMLSTRSCSRRMSKKEQDSSVTVNSEPDTRNIAKSPLNRKLRKRPADMEADTLQSKSKRVLRSSNPTQVTAENVLPEVRNAAEQLHKNITTSSESKGTMKSVSSSDNLLSCESMNDGQGDDFTLENNHVSSQNEHTGAVECDIIFEKSKRRTKPVIELSKCLADNANAVSMITGSVSNLDVNKNINPTEKSTESYSNLLGSPITDQHLEKHDSDLVMENLVESPKTSHCMKQGIEHTKASQSKTNESLTGNKDSDLTNANEYPDNDEGDNRSEQNSSYNKQHNEVINMKQKVNNSLEDKLLREANMVNKNPVVQLTPLNKDVFACKQNIVSYSDLDLYTEERNTEDTMPNTLQTDNQRRKENILCTALDRYGVISVKYAAKKVPDSITLKICQKIEESIPKIIASSKTEQKSRMDDLVTSIQNFNTKHILAGLMKYLKDPTRKSELFNKIVNGPAPPMTKSEVILLYVVDSLNGSLTPDFINRLWNNMEHTLFQLNRAPQFDVIESVSHFYAVLCRYFRNKSRLRCFMLDAMYCLQFKAVPLIRQCLEVCPGILPNAHERMAKTSLVTCLVYLLHFYKCQDKFNRAQDIRNILNRKYQYRFSEWNETMILEIFRKAIMDLRGTQNDKKMLRVALIILCKRHGAKWCQLNIIQNMLLPIIDKKEVPDRIKQFCVLMLGPLLKPFPADRKAQCEIVINQLLQMLKQNVSGEMKEAIYSSLIFMNKHDQERVVQALLTWIPEKVSREFEEILNDYVMEKPLSVWKRLVSRKPSQCS